MSTLCTVMESTYHAANTMVSTLYEYGDSDLGRGIRRLVVNSYDLGFVDGQYVGIAKGVAGTVLAYGTVKLVIKGSEFIKDKIDKYNSEKCGDVNHEQM